MALKAENRVGAGTARSRREMEAADPSSASLFMVERRLPRATRRELGVAQSALTRATIRFVARGVNVRYVRSIYLAQQDLLLSLFTAASLEAVRAVNEAALIPFTRIEPAFELAGPDGI